MLGVILTTTGGVLWIILLPNMMSGHAAHPYMGIAMFITLPGIFFVGLALMPLGVWLKRWRDRRRGLAPEIPAALDLRSPQVRCVLTFFVATTMANVVIGAQFTYRAIAYMDSVPFCGETCHTVMEPEFTAYQNSPHSRVECVSCHIGSGANWFVKSKISGTWQVIAVTFNLYEKPIPTPVRNLRPARETCEQCHWPQKFGADRVRVVPKYAGDEANSVSKTVLLMRIGGGETARGIHGTHMRAGVTIRYAPSDEKRQTIPWVEYDDGQGHVTQYRAADAKPGVENGLAIRVMDCMDCHTRPSHSFDLPERAVDRAMAGGEIAPGLPFAKKQAVELLKNDYPSHEAADKEIVGGFEKFYREQKAGVYQQKGAEVKRSARAVAAIYRRNVFPAMNVKWGIYPNNIGHTDFPGCFRCHDDNHLAADQRKITQDCNACHQLLAMDEAKPKILEELGEQ